MVLFPPYEGEPTLTRPGRITSAPPVDELTPELDHEGQALLLEVTGRRTTRVIPGESSNVSVRLIVHQLANPESAR
jgi:hypothetical protein